MRKTILTDIIVILCAAGVLLLINYLGYSDLLKRYAFIWGMITYFAGKAIGQRMKKKDN